MKSKYLNKLLRKTKSEIDSDQKSFIYIESKWCDNTLDLYLYTSDTNRTFKGQLTSDQFGKCADDLDIALNDFYSECKEALTANVTLPPFEYEILEEEPKFRLIKKVHYSIEYLEIPLKALNNTSAMFEATIDLINDLQEETKMSKKDDSTTKELIMELNQCVKEKEDMERKLLRKFLLLLNSKKDRINELQGKLQKKQRVANIDDEQDESSVDESRDDDFDALTQAIIEDAPMETRTHDDD